MKYLPWLAGGAALGLAARRGRRSLGSSYRPSIRRSHAGARPRLPGPRDEFYHVTTREHADAILREGFFPGWGDIGLGLYFYGDLASARAYAKAGGWDGRLRGASPVILAASDPRIEKVASWDLHPSWDPEKYWDMYWLPVDEDDDLLPVDSWRRSPGTGRCRATG